MSQREDGGPAFPFPIVSQNQATGETAVLQSEIGMSLRDYFIAHAPAEPWPEFSPKMPDRPTAPPIHPVGNDGEAPTDEECVALDNWRIDPCWDPETEYPKYSYWIKSWDDYWRDSQQHQKNMILQRRIQWPAYWADTQLKERKA